MSFQKSIKVQHKTPISFLCSDFFPSFFFPLQALPGIQASKSDAKGEQCFIFEVSLYLGLCRPMSMTRWNSFLLWVLWARAQILSSSHMDRGRVGEKELQSWEEEEDSDWVEDQGMYLRGRWRVREQQFMWTLFLTEPKTQGEKCFVVRCLISQ